jgi:hypothetical protein
MTSAREAIGALSPGAPGGPGPAGSRNLAELTAIITNTRVTMNSEGEQ